MTEHQHQVALFQWAALREKAYPELKNLYAIPNGGHRNKAVAAKLKKEGVKAGYPDINLDIARHGFNGLRIELKAPGGRLQNNQSEWIQRLTDAGYMAVVCVGVDSAIQTICDYLEIER